MTANNLVILGLVLDIVGVFLIWRFDFSKRMPVKSSVGKTFRISMEGDSNPTRLRRFLAAAGLPLILTGCAIQILALWLL